MSNDFITISEGPDTRDGYQRYAQHNPYQQGHDVSVPASFSYGGAPTETDLLPDDEYDSVFRPNPHSKAHEYDVGVIGSGPAGRAAAVRASRQGAKVIMFEREGLGGLWLNSGCVPATVYLDRGEGHQTSLLDAFAMKNSLVTKLAAIQARLLRACRVRVEVGEAVLKSAHEIFCRGRVYTVSKIILCGGTKTDYPAIPGLSHPGVITIEKLFDTTDVPNRLLVLGGSSEGCELAAAFTSYGSDVMLVESGPHLLAGWDNDITDAVEKMLVADGAKVHTGIAVKDIVDRGGNPFVITERGGVLCDKVLVATGRKPDISALGALMGEVDIDDGIVVVDEYMETNIPGIFAAGDVTGLGFQTHAACRMAETAAANAMGEKKVLDLWAVPSAIFTNPEVGSVGMTEDEARVKYGDELLVGYRTFSDNIRAMITGKTEGFVKVLAGAKHGEIYGAHIVGAGAADMVSGVAALMRMEITINEVVGDIIHAHPTYMEAFADACADALGGER